MRMALWLIFWTVGGAVAAYVLVWMVLGRESISIDEAEAFDIVKLVTSRFPQFAA